MVKYATRYPAVIIENEPKQAFFSRLNFNFLFLIFSWNVRKAESQLERERERERERKRERALPGGLIEQKNLWLAHLKGRAERTKEARRGGGGRNSIMLGVVSLAK